MSIEQKLCKVLNVITCIHQRLTVKNSGILCLALIFNLSYPRMTILHTKKLVRGIKVASQC